MNKLFTKIAGVAIGLTMAIGVGVSVGSNKEALPVRAETQTATFAPSNFSGQGTSGSGSSCSATIDSITVSTDKGYGTTQFRVYSGGTLTISSSAGNISAIDFTTSGSYGGGLSDVSGLNQTTWTTTTSGQARITSIIVTYDDGQGGETTTYSVYYNANSGEGAPENDINISEEDAEAYTLAVAGSMSRSGYTTDGWATSENGAKVYDFGEQVDLTEISTNNSLTLYAHWNKVVTPNKIIFAEEGLENGVQYALFGTDDDSDGSDRSYLNFTIEFAGGNNDGMYYTTGSGIRTYGGGSFTITAKDSKKIATILTTWDGSNKPANTTDVSVGTYVVSSGEWSGLSNAITFTRPSGSGHWRLKSVEITLGTQPVESITLTPSALNVLSDNLSAQTIEVNVEPNDADVLALTIDKGGENVATVSKSSMTGDGTFTVTGKGLTSGSQTITVSATDGSSVSATLVLTAVDASTPVLVSITVDQTGLTHKTQYVGNAFNPEGLTFTPIYNKTNPDPATIIASDFEWSTLVAGQNVVGTYKEDNSILVTIDTITVKDDVLSVTISGDELTNPDFLTTDSWNHNGITASASWESGTSYSGEIAWTYSPETPAAMGVDEAGVLTITATAGGASDSVDVLVSVSKPREVITERIDTLDFAFTGIESAGTTYADWTNDGDESGITYVAQTASQYSTIQLRSNNSNSGIVTTSQHGYVKSVRIVFNEHTTDTSREVDIYGKNTAYSAATNLYNSSLQGTIIGSAVLSDGADQTIDINSEYQYIGLRSKSGALWLDEIVITWSYVHDESDVNAVDAFVAGYMHLDYDNGGTIGSTSGNGSCVNYYDKNGTSGAKYHFTQLTDAQKEIILKSKSVYGIVGEHKYTYNEIKNRLSEWARINGDTLNEQSGAFSSAKINSLLNTVNDSSATTIIVIVSMISVSAIGGYFFLRRRKVQ